VRFIFVTGTDTGVGKSLLTALLLTHLQQTGHDALALKPFCSGSRADAELLYSLQAGKLSLDEINPFYFPEPVAPLIAARKHRRSIPLADVLRHIQKLAKRGPRSGLLIEGAGGLLVPLGTGYTWAEVINKLACEVIIVSANRLGTINHTLLTLRALQGIGHKQLTIVMMDVKAPRVASADTRYNAEIVSELAAPIPVYRVPFLGTEPLESKALKKNAKKMQKVLAQVLASDKVTIVAEGNTDKKKKQSL
jgi:dethiobiotin synthetase